MGGGESLYHLRQCSVNDTRKNRYDGRFRRPKSCGQALVWRTSGHVSIPSDPKLDHWSANRIFYKVMSTKRPFTVQ